MENIPTDQPLEFDDIGDSVEEARRSFLLRSVLLTREAENERIARETEQKEMDAERQAYDARMAALQGEIFELKSANKQLSKCKIRARQQVHEWWRSLHGLNSKVCCSAELPINA